MIRMTGLALVFSAALLGGCVSDEPHRPIPPQPADIEPTRLGVWATLPEDTDANGYLDTVNITVYISSDSFAAPIAVPGSFEFRLLAKGGKELCKWTISEEKTAKALRRMPAGPAYFFRLSMLDVGSDKYDGQGVDLAAEFKPRTGSPVRAPLTALPFGKVRP
jgi:hypothetical protein